METIITIRIGTDPHEISQICKCLCQKTCREENRKKNPVVSNAYFDLLRYPDALTCCPSLVNPGSGQRKVFIKSVLHLTNKHNLKTSYNQ